MNDKATTRWRAGKFARALAAAAGLAALGGAPAMAQFFGSHDGPLPPGAIVRSLMRQGFLEIDPPRLNGSVYVVDGVNARGRRVRLVVDAYDGDLLSRTRLEAPLLPPRDVGSSRHGRDERFEEADEFEPPRGAFRSERFDAREVELPPPPRRVEGSRPRLPELPRSAREESLERGPPAGRAAGKPRGELKATAAAPTPGAKPKGEPAQKRSATAAVAPAAPARPEAQPAPMVPAAPAPIVETPKPDAPKEAPAATADASARPVRVIEGVTPVVPQSGEPPKITVEEPPDITPPLSLE